MNIFISLVAAILAIFLGTAHATQIWLPPRLVIPVRTDLPVQLQSVRIRGEVSGRMAFTELELTFFNPNARILEGELQFPLLDGQRMASFAMDVNGAMREAVPVDKAKGQAVFEDVIRGRIDPGLLEVTQGNNFKLRVYPIPAAGSKRVVLRISESLPENNGRLSYRLPIEYAEQVGTFSLAVTVAGATEAPVSTSNAFGTLTFVRQENGFRADVLRQQFAGRGVLQLDILASRAAHISTEVFEGRRYFHADVPFLSREAPRTIPNRVSLVWDSSGSGASRDHGREFALLDGYFKKMGRGEVRLTRVRDVAEASEKFTIVDGNWRALREALSNTIYDGATNLGAYVPDREAREVLLFSDGISNYGESLFPVVPVPLYTVSAAIKADATALKFLAHRSGGRFIDLTLVNGAQALFTLTHAVTRVTSIEADGANELVMAQPFAERGRVYIGGMLTEATSVLRINVLHPDGKTGTLTLPIVGSASAQVAARWASLRINNLEGVYEFNRAEIRRLGRAFGLVTKETSLIVLDRLEDYVRYEIVPPLEMRADYQRMLATTAQQRVAERKSHLENIVRLFNEKAAWWNREFPKERKFKKEIAAAAMGQVQQMNLQSRADSRSELSQSAPAAAAPTPASATSPAPAVARMAAANAPPLLESRVADAAKATSSQAASSATIKLQKWQPDSPYATRLQNAEGADIYRIYQDEKPSYPNSTAFYLDAADLFFAKGLHPLGLRILSNLAEMDLENRHILRVLGYRLVQAGQPKLALSIFKKVLLLSPEEPQSYRDLGLAFAAANEPQKAIDNLNEVVIRPWHGRFPEIELITLAELNNIVATTKEKLDTSAIDARLLKNLPLDLRVILTWDADNTDIDLWVTDPDGERAYYGNRLTYQGGRMSLDFTGGYGPEEFSLKHAKPGKYKVEANYFGDRRQNVTGVTTLQVKLTSKFGSAAQKEEIVTLRLKGKQEVVFVGEFEVK